MKIFLAGATGAIGRPLLKKLRDRGHEVIATTRSRDKLAILRETGADPILMDAFDPRAVRKAVGETRPDVVIHEMTALANFKDLKHFDREFALTNRLRTEGTRNLLEAAQAAGAERFIAQSYTGWPNDRHGARIQTEADPLDSNPPHSMQETLNAIKQLERMVMEAKGISGIVLRYGSFYGPGTSVARDGDIVAALRAGKLPIVGNGAGIWSWIHIEDAAEATVIAVERAEPGIYNIVDDEPAEIGKWLPALAEAAGAKPPKQVPTWIARLLIGEAGIYMMTQSRGSSNKKAKTVLGWQPRYASWREGFRTSLAVQPAIHSEDAVST